MSDYVFELNAEEYLFKARKNTCFFVIHKTELGSGPESNIYLIGDLFLRHFYSVYDFERDEVSLGVNSHSLDKVHMYSPGQRPESIDKLQVESDDFAHIDSLESYASQLSDDP